MQTDQLWGYFPGGGGGGGGKGPVAKGKGFLVFGFLKHIEKKDDNRGGGDEQKNGSAHSRILKAPLSETEVFQRVRQGIPFWVQDFSEKGNRPKKV